MTESVRQSPETVSAPEALSKFLIGFFVLYKNARIFEENNPVFQRQCRQLFDQLQTMAVEHDKISVKGLDGHYFVNGQFVRFDAAESSGATGIVKEWNILGIGGVEFPSDVTQKELEEFFKYGTTVKLYTSDLKSGGDDPAQASARRIRWLSLVESRAQLPDTAEEARKHFRTVARKTFFRSMSVVREVAVSAAAGQEINVSRTKRVVHSLVDQIIRDESSLLELTAIKDYDDYTYAHSTNVCVYALVVGVRLGIDRQRLSHLGFAALFHDVGKVRLPKDLIRKPDAFDENDWKQMQLHPHLGAKTILRNLKLDIHTARAARGAFEHHINADFTGYPRLHYKQRTPNLFSRIIAIVDSFDALTTGRVYMKKSNPTDKVLAKMNNHMAVKFDPFLLKIFHDIIGVYPAGTFVLLSTEELALVLANNDTFKDRPYVKIVGNHDGLLDSSEWTDLSQPDQSHRRIVRMIDPEAHGLNVRDFVLDD